MTISIHDIFVQYYYDIDRQYKLNIGILIYALKYRLKHNLVITKSLISNSVLDDFLFYPVIGDNKTQFWNFIMNTHM
jgi:hypothetical protein